MFGLFSGRQWPAVTIDEIRRRARVLVIDDRPFEYLELFRRDGYTVEQWPDVERLNQLENGEYDIIILDISGVGKAISADEGVGVLRHVKKTNPTQIVVACSDKSFSLKFKEFFDLADAALEKSTDYVDFKAKIDELLLKRFSLGFYLDHVMSIGRPHVADLKRLRSTAERAILRRDRTLLEKYARQNVGNNDAMNMLLQVAQVAIGVLGLFYGR